MNNLHNNSDVEESCLHGRVELVGDAGPVGDGARVGGVHRRAGVRVKLPVLRAFEEIDLVVRRPD